MFSFHGNDPNGVLTKNKDIKGEINLFIIRDYDFFLFFT